MFAADVLSRCCRVHDAHRRPVGHHNIDAGEVWDRVLGDGFGVRCTLMGGVVAVFIAGVWEGKVAELWLVRGCVDLKVVSLQES